MPEDAYTAETLGTERAGQGVVIRWDGLVLTIGYLITEAEEVWPATREGRRVPAHVLAYDYASGFGLVQAIGPWGRREATSGRRCIRRSSSAGRRAILPLVARIVAAGIRRYREYLLDEALFTAPAHPNEVASP